MKKLTIAICLMLLSALGFTQETDQKTVTYFEKFIIAGNKPPDADVQTKYENDYRVIVWNDQLIKDYKYSNEAFDKLGYEFVKKNINDNQKRSKVYRSCSKGIIIEVTEWYNTKLSISMEWYTQSARKNIVYLMFCESKKQSEEEVSKRIYESFKADAIDKYKNKTINYSDRKNKPVLVDGTNFLKDYYYEIIQKSNVYAIECLQIIINKDGTKELDEEINDRTLYTTFITFIKNELPKLIFSNPKESVYDDLISVTTRIDMKVNCEIKYLGIIKVNYDSKNSLVIIKSKVIPDEIKSEELLKYLKDKKDGASKLSYYKINMKLVNCYAGDCFSTTTFIGYKTYEKGDEIQTY